MGSKKVFLTLAVTLTSMISGSCVEQFNPREDWKKFRKERELAHRNLPKLTPDGRLPGDASAESGDTDSQASSAPVNQKYVNFCASCHGEKGDANAPAAAALDPKPRDFTDAAWQDEVDDEKIAKVIKEGGPAVGMAPTMAPWGSMLSDEDIVEMVKTIRAFKK